MIKEAQSHRRVNDILLGPLERPALRWLAAHLPAWATPDLCTSVGVLGALLTAAGYGLSHYHPGFFWLASLGFVVNWLGDSLDGTLARHRHIERPLYGYFVDHSTDAFSQLMIFVGLGLSPYMNFNVACLTLVAYLMLSVVAYLRTYVAGEFKISYGKLGPTESRVIAILLNTAMYFFGPQPLGVFQGQLSLYDLIVAAIGLLLFWFFLTTAITETRRLAQLGE